MNIQDAQARQKNGKAWIPNDKTSRRDEYVLNVGGVMTWFGLDDAAINPVAYCLLKRDEWEPFPEVKEIRPEGEKELWECEDGRCAFTHFNLRGVCQGLYITAGNGLKQKYGTFKWHEEIIHNKNDWTRLYPPVKDDSIEIVEIERVKWKSEGNGLVLWEHGPLKFSFIDSLENKPPMKMILEIPKDRP